MVVIFLALTSIYAFYKTKSFLFILLTVIVFTINKIARRRMDHDRVVKKLPSDQINHSATDINIITFLILLILFIYAAYRYLTA